MNTQVDIAIYNSEYPLEVSSNKQIQYVLPHGKQQVFLVNFTTEYREAEIHLKVEQGDLSYSISDQPDFPKENTIKSPMFKKILFSDTRKANSNDVIIFSKILIKVTAANLCKFSLRVKPKEMFIMMKPFEVELVKPDKHSDIYVYFSLDQNDVKHYKNLVLDLIHVGSPKESFELLFNGVEDVQLDQNNPFLPMPIKEQRLSLKHQELYHQIFPEIKQGFYIVKISQS